MHPEAWVWLARSVQRLDVAGKAVLEFGSRDVNGSPRPLFAGCHTYVGVDLVPGPGVDVVGDAKEYFTLRKFDVVVCTEMLEHDPEPWRVLENARRNLRARGVLLLTAAAPPRAPHGSTADGSMTPGEHYRNITPDDLREWLKDWANVELTHDAMHGDVYVWAVAP